MPRNPSDCADHVWASIGTTVVDGTVSRIWECEKCVAWTSEPLDEDNHVPWADTEFSA